LFSGPIFSFKEIEDSTFIIEKVFTVSYTYFCFFFSEPDFVLKYYSKGGEASFFTPFAPRADSFDLAV